MLCSLMAPTGAGGYVYMYMYVYKHMTPARGPQTWFLGSPEWPSKVGKRQFVGLGKSRQVYASGLARSNPGIQASRLGNSRQVWRV